jgi:hypothetical protein
MNTLAVARRYHGQIAYEITVLTDYFAVIMET